MDEPLAGRKYVKDFGAQTPLGLFFDYLNEAAALAPGSYDVGVPVTRLCPREGSF